MDLQWQLILTQIVAFLIVLWILRKYAWGKLLDFMEKRRELIASEFEQIDKSKSDVEALRAKYEKELADIETTRRHRIQQAMSEASELAASIKEEARKDAVAARLKTKQDIELELDKANVALRDRMVDAVLAATERLIREHLDADKHRRLIDRFLDEVDIQA